MDTPVLISTRNFFLIIIAIMFTSGAFGYAVRGSRNNPHSTKEVMVQIDTLYVERNEAIMILQDSLSQLSYEKIKSDEEIAILRNANRNLTGRVWAINEYIRTGRFPADSTIRRKFGGNTR